MNIYIYDVIYIYIYSEVRKWSTSLFYKTGFAEVLYKGSQRLYKAHKSLGPRFAEVLYIHELLYLGHTQRRNPCVYIHLVRLEPN